MIKTSIRNLHSDKDIPPRFCNVIVNGDDVTLEVKINKNKFETISWEDMQYQVNQAIMKAAKELIRNYRKLPRKESRS